MEAIMAEKPMVPEAEPRKPRREPSMHKMRTREPAPAEAHAAAHGAEMHSSGYTAGMHAPSHAATMHTTSATAASQCRRRNCDRRTKRTSYEATNEPADHPTASVFSAPMRVNRRADYPLQMTKEIFSDTKVIFTHGNAVIYHSIHRTISPL
jgi:hypothetical protein